MIDAVLIHSCAPQIAIETVRRIIQVESAGDSRAIHVNGVGRVLVNTNREAASEASRWIDAGYSVDLGLMQINSRHLSQWHLSVAQAFEPCTNIKAGAAILQQAYRQSVSVSGPGQRALQAAFSIYNTGDSLKGFTNGYVAAIYRIRLEPPVVAEVPGFRTPSAAPTSVFASRPPSAAALTPKEIAHE